jgi:hypothetical protein
MDLDKANPTLDELIEFYSSKRQVALYRYLEQIARATKAELAESSEGGN